MTRTLPINIKSFLLFLLVFTGYLFAGNSQTPSPKIRAGVFNGNGASPVCVLETMEALKMDPGIIISEVSAAEIILGKLDQLDVLVFPGGSGSKEFNNLGTLAAEKVRAFADQYDKGIVGICAGGYLLSTTPTYPSLEMLDAPDTREFYDRGRGLIGFKLNEIGKTVFYEVADQDIMFVQYYDGPIFENPGKYGLNVFGTIETDIDCKKTYPKDFTPGKPAFFTKNYGKGKLFVSVGHPEATAGMRWMVPRMVRYVANADLITYHKDLIRPSINTKALLYYPSVIKREKELYWQLFSDDDKVVHAALNGLGEIRSRPSIRWALGLLRHSSPFIRLKAAEYLCINEYTAAISDLEASVNMEKDEYFKGQMEILLSILKNYVHE